MIAHVIQCLVFTVGIVKYLHLYRYTIVDNVLGHTVMSKH